MIPCKAINDMVLAGYLEPCRILGPSGEDLNGYRPTAAGQRYFGPQFAEREAARENVVDMRGMRP